MFDIDRGSISHIHLHLILRYYRLVLMGLDEDFLAECFV